jgi:chromosome segregation ATPase
VERTKQALARAERDLRDAQALFDSTLSRLREKNDSLVRAENQIATMQAERARVTVAIEAFERDLKTQSIEAGRLREQITMLRDNEASVLAVRAELERVDRERGTVRDEARRLRAELSRMRDELKGLERWKVEHSCGG